MKIDIYSPKEKKDTLTILIDEEPWRNIHMAVFGRRPKFPSTAVSQAEWQAVFDEIEYRQAKNYVLRRLSLQSYYSVQLERLLKERFIQASTIHRLIKECTSLGYLNDESWLDAFMRGHMKRYGMRTIASKLQAKGVVPDVVQELIEKWRNPEEELESIRHLLQTRYRSKDLKSYKDKQKVIAALARKGYSFEQIQNAINREINSFP